jgi:hypothetical protein
MTSDEWIDACVGELVQLQPALSTPEWRRSLIALARKLYSRGKVDPVMAARSAVAGKRPSMKQAPG